MVNVRNATGTLNTRLPEMLDKVQHLLQQVDDTVSSANKALADIISMVKHAANKGELQTAQERVDGALERLTLGRELTPDQQLWLERIRQHKLPIEKFQWYLDVRKYGTFPHSGFGMGVERVVAWISGVPHLRETIPYPRMLNRIYP